MSVSRRHLLRAAGGALVVPAFLRRALAAEGDLPPRLVIMMQANGVHQPGFWPDASFRSPVLAPLLDDPALAPLTTVVKQVRVESDGPGVAHDIGYYALWTGVRGVGTPNDPWAGGPSIDQVLKQKLAPRLPYPTLACGVQAAEIAPKHSHRTSFTYLRARQQVPTETDPVRLYAALFRGRDGGADPARAARRLVQRRSVIDHVATDLRRLGERLGGFERQKLDAHATAVREMEGRLGAVVAAPPGVFCGARERPPLDARAEDLVPALLEAMIEVVAQALACNLTRFVNFGFGHAGGSWLFRWMNLNMDWHGEIAHKDTGADPVAAERMTSIGRWHAGYVARLARALAAIPHAGGTVLDDALVVWANENGNGSHSLENIPVVMVGRAGGRLRETGRVVDAGPVSQHRLATSVMRLMGVEAAGFGDRPDCGPVPGLG